MIIQFLLILFTIYFHFLLVKGRMCFIKLLVISSPPRTKIQTTLTKFTFRTVLQCPQHLRELCADLSLPQARASSSLVGCGIYGGHDFLRVARQSLDTVIQSTLHIILTDTVVN